MKLDRIALWAAVYLLVALAPSMGQETKSSSGTDDPLPSWNEGAAKTQLFTIFDALTAKDPIALNGRRKLSSLIFA